MLSDFGQLTKGFDSLNQKITPSFCSSGELPILSTSAEFWSSSDPVFEPSELGGWS